jgi:hypothetical protein
MAFTVQRQAPAPGFSNAIQRNGGHGGVRVDPNDPTWLIKSTNPTEMAFYRASHAKEISDFMPKHGGRARLQDNEIRIENIKAGMREPKLMDIKIGSRTVSKEELLESGSTDFAAWHKRNKMRFADVLTGSQFRGYRVIAYDGDTSWTRFATGVKPPSWSFAEFFGGHRLTELFAIGQLVKLSEAQALRSYKIVAGSVIICYDAENPHNVQVKLIDFAHSSIGPADDPDIIKYSQLFLAGLTTLITDMRAHYWETHGAS